MKRILVTPLNWGLGHASRCIPIIDALIERGFTPIIGSDGIALDFLKKEFPDLDCLELPSYKIQYSKSGKHLKWKLLLETPRILKAIRSEHEKIKEIIERYAIDGIISDNRFGTYHEQVPSVFISHQIKVLSGNTTWFSSKINSQFINRFDQCWIPDVSTNKNLSGILSNVNGLRIPWKKIGILSRFEQDEKPMLYDLLIVLSGPEPQRTQLEAQLLDELKNYKGRLLFVKGCIEAKQSKVKRENKTIVNFLLRTELEEALNQSSVVLSRSGYSSIMDLAKLKKKAFFIPTPGQPEQLYLAEYLEEMKIAPFAFQDDFKLEQLEKISGFSGFELTLSEPDYDDLLGFFKCERELTPNA